MRKLILKGHKLSVYSNCVPLIKKIPFGNTTIPKVDSDGLVVLPNLCYYNSIIINEPIEFTFTYVTTTITIVYQLSSESIGRLANLGYFRNCECLLNDKLESYSCKLVMGANLSNGIKNNNFIKDILEYSLRNIISSFSAKLILVRVL